MQQLVKRTVQWLTLLRALFNQLCSQSVNINLGLSRNNRLASIKRKAQIVERLRLESLVLHEGCHDFLGNDMEERLKEVKEANVTVFVSVE